MNSNMQGLLWVVAGIFVLAAFVRDIIDYISHGGLLPGENPILAYGLTVLMLVGAISCFVSAINAFKQKD